MPRGPPGPGGSVGRERPRRRTLAARGRHRSVARPGRCRARRGRGAGPCSAARAGDRRGRKRARVGDRPRDRVGRAGRSWPLTATWPRPRTTCARPSTWPPSTSCPFVLPTLLRRGIDSLLERPALGLVADTVETLSLAPAFSTTVSGALLLDVRGRLRLMRGERELAIEDLRRCGEINDALGFRNPGCLTGAWRSTAALALREIAPAEAAHLVAEELALARATGLPRAQGVALRASGLVQGGRGGNRATAGIARSAPAFALRARARSHARRARSRATTREPPHGSPRVAGRRSPVGAQLRRGAADRPRNGGTPGQRRARTAPLTRAPGRPHAKRGPHRGTRRRRRLESRDRAPPVRERQDR